jgi:hypothetical protein
MLIVILLSVIGPNALATAIGLMALSKMVLNDLFFNIKEVHAVTVQLNADIQTPAKLTMSK